ncbi:hypothetical protein [uncultured Sphingomonas sp.]|uniref:hypothetical protein n=1 Tax=uncultured Sphingomonas sp. TaxID=158754 RepID=UPI0035CACC76
MSAAVREMISCLNETRPLQITSNSASISDPQPDGSSKEDLVQSSNPRSDAHRAFHVAQLKQERANASAATDRKAKIFHEELAKFHMRAAGIKRDAPVP